MSSSSIEGQRRAADISLRMAGFPWWGARQPAQLVDLQVNIEEFLLAGFGLHQLNGRYICLWVQLGHLPPDALADVPFCLCLSFRGGM